MDIVRPTLSNWPNIASAITTNIVEFDYLALSRMRIDHLKNRIQEYITRNEYYILKMIRNSERDIMIQTDIPAQDFWVAHDDERKMVEADLKAESGLTIFVTQHNECIYIKFIMNPVVINEMPHPPSGLVKWAARVGGASLDNGQGICSLSDGGVVVTGYATGPITVYHSSGGTFVTNGALIGNEDVYIVKYSPSGTCQWVTKLGAGSTAKDNAKGICTMNDGSFCITGFYSGAFDAYNATGTRFATISFTTIAGGGTNTSDVFLAKYSSAGVGLWVARLASSTEDKGNAICSLGDGGICVTGFFSGPVFTTFHFTGTALMGTTLARIGVQDLFIAKYSSTGSSLWVTKIGTSSNDAGNGICGTSDGGLCVTGNLQGAANAPFTAFNSNGSTFIAVTTLSAADAFMVKYTAGGTGEWMVRLISNVQPKGITSMGDGGICLTGSYSNILTAYHKSGETFTTLIATTGTSTGDTFIIKYSLLGMGEWVTRLATKTDSCSGNAICSTTDGGICIAGNYKGEFTAYSSNWGGFATLTPTANIDTFVARYSWAGVGKWIAKIETNTATTNGFGICSLMDGGICITGTYSGSFNAYHASGNVFATLPTGTGGDVFITKYY